MSRRSNSRSIAVKTAAAVLAASLSLAAAPNFARAEESAPGALAATGNPSMAFAGEVNANDVYVRSGPGDNYYATLKLDKGASITVVGMKFDWLKIVPPEGSFCYVAKAYVEKRGDGTVGRVTKPELNVRAGSALNAMKSTVETKLDEGVDVQILGEQDEYFKIKPPAGAYLYVNKQFVQPVRSIAVAPAVVPAVASAQGGGATGGDGDMAPMPAANAPIVTHTPQPSVSVAPVQAAATTQPATVAAAPTTQPWGTVGTAVASASTQPAPAEPSIEARFDAAEAAFLDATAKPLDAQPLEKLQARYTTLTNAADLPVSMRRIAEMRLQTIKARQDVRDQYVATMKMQAAAHAKELALKAEQQELQQRVKDQEVTMYTAIGTLRTSSLQPAGGTLYRLTDPGTGRTLLYVRSDDPKYATIINQFVGVRGTITEDSAMNLKVLTPTLAEPVDESKVNTTVSAEMIPPTLMPKAPTASIAGD